MGLGTDIDTGLPMSLSMNVYAKYQWQNYGAANENEWDGYRFKIKYFVPITDLWGGQLSYIGFTNFDWGSDLGDDSGNAINGIKTRTNNSIASSHILALNYDHWHYSVVARYWHDGGQWNDDAELNFGNGNFNVRSTGWGGYGSRLQLLIVRMPDFISGIFITSSCSSSLSGQRMGCTSLHRHLSAHLPLR